jgi:hypothetical protein
MDREPGAPMISDSTSKLLDKVRVLRAGLDMDVIRIQQMHQSPRTAAGPVRELGMRLHGIGQDLMDHAEELDQPDGP